MTKSSNKGFTLLEIVVAVAIIGVLAAVASVFYKDYVTRARVSEALVFADAGRTKLEVEWAEGKRQSQQEDLLNAAGKPVDMMTGLTWVRGTPADAYAGYIMAEMNLPGFGKRKVLALELRQTGDWHCVGAGRFATPEESLDEKYLPAQCRDGQAVARVGGGPASQTVATPTGQAAAPAAACPAGQDKVQRTDAKGIAVSLCLPACPAGQTRNAQDPGRCDAPAKPASQADCQPNESYGNGVCQRVCSPGWHFVPGPPATCSKTPPAAPAATPVPAAPGTAQPQTAAPTKCNGGATYTYADGHVVCDNPCKGNASNPLWVGKDGSGRDVDACVPDCGSQGKTLALSGSSRNWTARCVAFTTRVISGTSADPCKHDANTFTAAELSQMQFTPQECFGPPAICQHLNRPAPNRCAKGTLPYTETTNTADGGKVVSLGCMAVSQCKEVNTQYQENDACSHYSLKANLNKDLSCTLCCIGDGCNNPNSSSSGCMVKNGSIVEIR